jgi:hypothetical protein
MQPLTGMHSQPYYQALSQQHHATALHVVIQTREKTPATQAIMASYHHTLTAAACHCSTLLHAVTQTWAKMSPHRITTLSQQHAWHANATHSSISSYRHGQRCRRIISPHGHSSTHATAAHSSMCMCVCVCVCVCACVCLCAPS